MTPISAATLTNALKWRYATKKFDTQKKIPDDIWAALEESLILAPSSMGLQPWKFVIVRDSELRERLTAAAYGQAQVADCSHFVVFAGVCDLSVAHIERYIERVAEVRGAPKDALKGYREMMVGSVEKARGESRLDPWMAHQAYIALGQFIASAALLGVDTCPMEGIEPDKFDELLGLKAQGYHTLVACAAGYRADGDKYATNPKVRFKAADVVVHH